MEGFYFQSLKKRLRVKGLTTKNKLKLLVLMYNQLFSRKEEKGTSLILFFKQMLSSPV